MYSRSSFFLVLILFASTPATAQLGAPFLSATPVSAQEIQLTWTWSNIGLSIQGLQVRRADTQAEIDTNFTSLGFVGKAGREFTDLTAIPGRTYWYRLAPYYVLFQDFVFVNLSNVVSASTVGQPYFTDALVLAMAGMKFPRGLAWGDSDGDGYPDLYATSDGGGSGNYNYLFRNLGDGTFLRDDTPPISDANQGQGAAWVDINNDRAPDLAFLNLSSTDHLLLNDGNGNFSSEAPGFGPAGPSTNMAWGDYDNDGYVDAFVVYTNDPGWSVALLRNMGGTYFADVTPTVLEDYGAGQSSSWIDVDNDGDLDLYFVKGANLGINTNRLFRNDGGTFTELVGSDLSLSGFQLSQAWGDYDNDGDLDVHITGYSSPSVLMRNDGNWNFTDVAIGAVASAGRSNSWVDYDNDGDLDLYVNRNLTNSSLLRNEGGGVFTDVAAYPINSTNRVYGATWADYDDDGDPDLALAIYNLDVRLYKNEIGSARHWIDVDLEGVVSNAGGIGAQVRVVADGYSQLRVVSGSSNYYSFHEATAHFGLGDFAGAEVDTLEIRWPSGIVQTLTQGAYVDRGYLIRESDSGATAVGPAPVARGSRILGVRPNPFNPATQVYFEVFQADFVLIAVFNAAGRRVGTVLEGRRPAGVQQVKWDGRDQAGKSLPSGVYYLKIVTSSGQDSRKVVLLR